MKQNTLITVLSGLVITMFVNTTVASSDKPAGQPSSQNTKATVPVPKALSDELSTCLKNNKIDISVKNQSLTAKGDLVLTLNGNACFSDKATITISTSRLDNMKTVLLQVKSVMELASSQSRKIKFIDVQDKDKMAVVYQN